MWQKWVFFPLKRVLKTYLLTDEVLLLVGETDLGGEILGERKLVSTCGLGPLWEFIALL